MGSVTCIAMDVVTEKSGHTIVPNAVSVCITPAAPSPLPIPYPVVGNVAEGISDCPMRTKVNGAKFATTGSVIKTCHGNEPGTLKEVVSLNTGGPCFPIMGAPVVLSELGMISITGSLCISNKSVTPGAGGNAGNAGGSGAAGGGGGGGGSGDGSPEGPENPDGGGGDGGDGTNEGAEADERAPAPDRYCPDENETATPAARDHIADMDLRRRSDAITTFGNDAGRQASRHARYGQPGGATATQGQAFWSGGDTGMAAARGQGYTIQEDAGGASGVARTATQPGWGDDSEAGYGAGSGVTNERLWKTISMRSAENASGTVDAFVTGVAHDQNVFSTVELPTLLHNPNCNQINFRDPHNPNGPPVSWARDGDGCWSGGDVPPGPVPTPPTPANRQVHGFRVHPTEGVARFR